MSDALESDAVESDAVAVDMAMAESTKDIALPSGESLQPIDTARIVGSRPTRIVLFAGAVDSGKTTLIASIYERFCRGPIAEYNFAGSDTLVAFERLCHLSRGVSQGVEADTERTKQLEGHKMLHLRLSGPSRASDLLLTDVSGEEYDAALASRDEACKLRILHRTDRVVLLVDGEKLANKLERHAAREQALNIVRAFIHANLFTKTTFLDVLVSKDDIMLAPDTAKEVDAVVSDLSAALNREFNGKLGRIRFGRVAARGTQSDPIYARGIDLFLSSWMQDSPLDIPVDTRIKKVDVLAQIDRYLERRLPERVQP